MRKHAWDLVAALVGAFLTALVATEVLVDSVREFWTQHPLTAGLVASAVALAVTVLVVDEVMRRRDAKRWSAVAETAMRELSTDAFAAWTDVMDAFGFGAVQGRFLDARWHGLSEESAQPRVEPILPPEFEPAVGQRLNDLSECARVAGRIDDVTEALSHSVAKWAPVMLQHADLAKALNVFSTMRDALISAGEGLRHASSGSVEWRWGFWVSLDYFHLGFGRFDTLRREALGEPTLFDTDVSTMRRTWGLPADRPESPPPQDASTAVR
jgi:hypothetical protein